jgi:integrase/recombinase XerC
MPEKRFPQIQSFVDYLKFEKRYSPHTIISYQSDLRDFFNYLDDTFGKVDLNNINHNQIRSWLAEQKEKGVTAKSLNRKISTLRSFFKYQLKNGKIDNSPVTKVIAPKIKKRLPVFLKEEDIKLLAETLETSSEDWKTLNARILVALFYNTGMRLTELINLKQKQVDYNKSLIKVLGKGNKERIIPLSRETVLMLQEYHRMKKKEFENSEDALIKLGISTPVKVIRCYNLITSFG